MSRPASEDWRGALGALLPADYVPAGNDASASESAHGCAAGDSAPSRAGQLRVSVERKGRGGKTATIVYGFADGYPEADIEALAATLKRRLGTGGSARGGEILIQGDRGGAVVDVLRSLGYKARPC